MNNGTDFGLGRGQDWSSKRRMRFLSPLGICALITATLLCNLEMLEAQDADTPQIVISQPPSPVAPPMPTRVVGTPVDTDGKPIADCLPIIQPRQIDVATYRSTYEAIPFSRTEYDANPSYRHDTAMEIMFGKMRPMTIHRHQNAVRPASQTTPWWSNAQPIWRNPGNSRIRTGVFYQPPYRSYLRRWY